MLTLTLKLTIAGYHEEKVRVVARALFTGHLLSAREGRRAMELAFDVWDEERRGVLRLPPFCEVCLCVS